MNGLYIALFVLFVMIVAVILVGVMAWRHRRSAQHLVPLTWSNIYHGAE